MRLALIPFLQTVSATAAVAAGLFFFRFWRESRDRLFAFFGAAFWVLALSWTLLALIDPSDETRPYVYGIRLIAFLLMIVGMVDKNRASR
jgi:drug/metabolite transporter superfamily protein YnfA